MQRDDEADDRIEDGWRRAVAAFSGWTEVRYEQARREAESDLRDFLLNPSSVTPRFRLGLLIVLSRSPGISPGRALIHTYDVVLETIQDIAWVEYLVFDHTLGVEPSRRPGMAAAHLLGVHKYEDDDALVWGTNLTLRQLRNIKPIIKNQNPANNLGLRQRAAALAGGYGRDRTVLGRERPALIEISQFFWAQVETRLSRVEPSDFDPAQFDVTAGIRRWHDPIVARIASWLAQVAVSLGAQLSWTGSRRELVDTSKAERASRRFNRRLARERPKVEQRRTEFVAGAVDDWINGQHGELAGTLYDPHYIAAARARAVAAKAKQKRAAARLRALEEARNARAGTPGI